jgi:hypothetical protein
MADFEDLVVLVAQGKARGLRKLGRSATKTCWKHLVTYIMWIGEADNFVDDALRQQESGDNGDAFSCKGISTL